MLVCPRLHAQPFCATDEACSSECVCPPDTHACEAGVCRTTFDRPTPLITTHRTLVREVAAADAGDGWDVVIYGDALVERMRGTSGWVLMELWKSAAEGVPVASSHVHCRPGGGR